MPPLVLSAQEAKEAKVLGINSYNYFARALNGLRPARPGDTYEGRILIADDALDLGTPQEVRRAYKYAERQASEEARLVAKVHALFPMHAH